MPVAVCDAPPNVRFQIQGIVFKSSTNSLLGIAFLNELATPDRDYVRVLIVRSVF